MIFPSFKNTRRVEFSAKLFFFSFYSNNRSAAIFIKQIFANSSLQIRHDNDESDI